MEFGLGQLERARPKAIGRWLWSALARRAIARAEALDPESVARGTEMRALSSFRRAARAVPAYRALLRENCVDPRQIVSIGDFHRLVPVVSKERLFDSHRLAALAANGRIGDATLVFTSSGHSGSFSFGLETRRQTSALTERIDALLDYYFRVFSVHTLLVNALPGAVRIPTRAGPVAELGPRPEAVLRAVESLGSDFEQIVLVAEPLLAKEVAEQARERGLDLTKFRVSAILGGEFVADAFRAYLAPSLGQLFTSFGISELGLSLAHDTAELRGVVSVLDREPELRRRVLGDAPFAPTLLQYYPDQYYLETPELDGRRSLVATTLDHERLIPLVRYRSGDWAEALPGGMLAERLAQAGRPELAPSSRLPMLAVYGRGNSIEVGGRRVYPEQIKSALFDDPELARLFTGRFRLESSGGGPELRVECRATRLPDASLRERLVPLLERRTSRRLGVLWETRSDAGFAGGFERKQRYVEST